MALRLQLKAVSSQMTTSLARTGWRDARSYGTRRESKPWKQKPNRKARLKVVLSQNVHKLGVKGQIVDVKHGYGRNYLIPQKMAVYATHYNIKDLNAFTIEEGSIHVDEIEYLTEFLASKELTVKVPPFESKIITESHISKAFRQNLQLHIPLDCIELSQPITDFSSKNSVMVRLNDETLVTVPVGVDASLTKKQQRKVDKRRAFLSQTASVDNG